jgi:DNA-directed RNA polymerase specialized sigma24 family protein
MPDDKELLRSLQSGDAAGLAAVYHRYKDDLLTVACCLIGQRADAEDVLHDVFVTLAGCCRDLLGS